MKKTDITLLAVIVIVSLTAAYFIGRAVMSHYKQNAVQVEVTDPISSAIIEPSKEIFNKDAINPAVPINIGQTNNQQPFGE